MSDIKVKERAPIKILDKAKIGTAKVKDNIIVINNKTDSTDNQYNNPEEYATEQIREKKPNYN